MKQNKKLRGLISMAMVFVLIFTNISIIHVGTLAEEIHIIEISTADELAKIGNDDNYPLDGSYRLANDIENVTTTIGQGNETFPAAFTGNFDGDGHSVTLHINAAKTYQGLFGQTNGATIKNVVVKGEIQSTFGWIAGITPKAVHTTIENCGSEVNISTTGNNMTNLAGIAGYSENTIISNCYNAGNISGKIKNTAGITGQVRANVIVENCYNSGKITTTSTSAPRVGGVIGYDNTPSNGNSNILNCYNCGEVTGTVQTGAFIGYIGKNIRVANGYYLEGTHEKAFGFQYDADTTQMKAVTDDELKGLAGILGDAYKTDVDINNGYPILKWQAEDSNTDEEDKALLEQLLLELPTGVIAPKYNKDKNINHYISELIEGKEAYSGKGITVSIKSIENRFSNDNTYIEKDGTINYFYTDLFAMGSANRYYGQVDVVFNISLNNITVEYAPRCINIYWNIEKLTEDMKVVANEYISEQILGNNDSLLSVTEKLELPVYPNIKHDDIEKNIKWVSVKYTSSDSSVISIQDNASWDNDFTNMFYMANVHRSSEDRDVTITAEFTFERYTINSGEDTVTESITKEIPVKVLAYNEELEQSKELEAKLASYTDKLTDFTFGGELDLNNVKNDIQLVIPGKLGLDGKYYNIHVESSDTSVMEIYGYRAYIYRPLPGEAQKDVTLSVSITNKENPNIKASIQVNLTVLPLTDKEIDEALEFMKLAKENFFSFIKNKNENAASITSDLKTFYGIYLDDNGKIYASDYVSKPNNNGIVAKIVNPEEQIPDNKRYWTSDCKDIIEDQVLRVTIPKYNTNVTVGAMISHEVYEKYAKRYADTAVYGEKFKQLADQKVNVKLTVIGEMGEETTVPVEEIDTSENETTKKNWSETTFIKESNANTYKKLKVKKFKAKVLKKSIKLSWKKNKKASGYQIKYWQKKKFKKAKIIFCKKNNKTKIKLKGLRKGRKYIFKIRAYKVAHGKKIYGKWTKKIKKNMK